MTRGYVIFQFLATFCVILSRASGESDEDVSTDLYMIEGKVFPWENGATPEWQLMTHVMANGGEFYGFLRFILNFYFYYFINCFCFSITLFFFFFFQGRWYIYYLKCSFGILYC